MTYTPFSAGSPLGITDTTDMGIVTASHLHATLHNNTATWLDDLNGGMVNALARIAALEAAVQGSGGSGGIVWTADSPPNGTQNATYGPYTFAATGTPAVNSYTLTSGSWPAGLSLNPSTGVLSGTPTGTGTTSGLVVTAANGVQTPAASPAFSITIAASGSTPTPPDQQAMALAHPGGGAWTLAKSDEFSGSSLDTTLWNPNWFGATTSTITKDSNGSMADVIDPALTTVANGLCTLGCQFSSTAVSANDGSGWTRNWRSGHLNTQGKYTFTHGYIEVRMSLPSSGGSIPNWPGAWTDTTGTWPNGGEFDFAECLGGSPAITVHSQFGDTSSFHPGGTWSGFHVYGMHWQTGLLDIYYDGVLVSGTSKAGSNLAGVTIPSNLSHFLIIQNSTGGSGGTQVSGANVQVDYFRHWT